MESIFTTIIVPILVIGFLIVFHEAGHFWVAKRVGVSVLKFSVGFGPKLFGRRVGETEYVVSAIPLGGFVKMIGEDPDEEVAPEEQAVSFSHQGLAQRTAIVAAGPIANLLFAFVAFSLVFGIYGAKVPSEQARVGRVGKEGPAADAGLKAGDLVVSVDGQSVASWENLSERIRASEGKTLALAIKRGEESIELPVTPEARADKNLFGEQIGTAFFIGIERGFDETPVSPVEAIGYGASQTYFWVQTLLTSVVMMVQGRIPSDQIGGPIMIVEQAGEQARQGLENLLHFMAIVSINLGVLNLLPIPILDGGHLFFFGIEAIMRRPLGVRHREMAQRLGLVVLLMLMAFAFYNDIARNWERWWG